MAAGEARRDPGGIDPMAEVEALAGLGVRAPGSDAERRAALHVAARLEALGRHAVTEPVDTWPAWSEALALAAAGGVVASVVSVSSPAVGAVIALLALVCFAVDAGAMGAGVRRLFGRRASQNVVSFGGDDRPGALVLVAHLDAGRTGFVHRPGVRRLGARLGRPHRLLGGPLQPVAWALVAVLAFCALRTAGPEGDALTAVQLVPTIALMVAVALLLDVRLSPTVAGAGDDASGVALALRLAERVEGELGHFDLHVVLTGAQESLGDGMRAFLRRHGAELGRDRTLFLNLDEVGAGQLRYSVREGPLLAARSHRQLVRLCAEIAADARDDAPRALDNRAPSDGFTAAFRGYASVTVTCRGELGLAPRHHRRSDLPEHVEKAALAAAEAFVAELVARVDAELGPELGSGRPS